jgi:hypothetical protein
VGLSRGGRGAGDGRVSRASECKDMRGGAARVGEQRQSRGSPPSEKEARSGARRGARKEEREVF